MKDNKQIVGNSINNNFEINGSENLNNDQVSSKHRGRYVFLKFLAVIGIFSFFYPFVLVVQYLLALNLPKVFGSADSCSLLQWKGSIAVYFPYLTGNIGTWILWAVFIMSFGLIVLRSTRRKLDEIMNITTLSFAVVLFVSELIACEFQQIPVNLMFFVYTFAVAYILILNQLHIDNIFINMNTKMADISKGVRGINALWICTFLGIVFVLLCLQGFIEYLIKYSIGLARDGLSRLILFLISALNNSPEKIVKATKDKPINQMMKMDSKGNPVLDGILTFVFIVIIIFILIVILPPLVKAITKWIKLLSLKFQQIFASLINKNKEEEIEEAEYLDTIEKVASFDSSKSKSSKPSHLVRNYSDLRGIKDLALKIRYLYGLHLDNMKKIGVEIKSSDTTDEILYKYKLKNGVDENFEDLTRIYKEVRYGEKVPEEFDEKGFLVRHKR